MPKLQSKSPTPQTESQYIPTQIKTVNSPTLPMTKECRKGAHKISKMQCQKQGKPNANVSMPADNKEMAGTFKKYMHHTPLGGLFPSRKITKPYSARWKSQIWRKKRTDPTTRSENKGQHKNKKKNRPKPNDKKASRKKAQGGEGERKKSEIFDNANPPAPSNPMHQNRRIPYTNAYQRISTNAETRHNAGLQYGQHKCERPVREWGVK